MLFPGAQQLFSLGHILMTNFFFFSLNEYHQILKGKKIAEYVVVLVRIILPHSVQDSPVPNVQWIPTQADFHGGAADSVAVFAAW